ncbi:MAG TPA: sugar ABC transporter substrate-binding protein [Caldilineaceae bacterium]|nr:sugar ABC transporter substrate-binding protein [Caldilineaceae bacterium]
MSQRANPVQISRRTFMRSAALVMGGAALAACATPSAPAPAAAEGGGEAAAPPADVVTISFMGWGNPGEDEGVRNAIAVFEEEQPNIKVQWLHTPENYAEKFLASIAAGTPPDTAFIGSADYGTYVRDGLLLDITDMLQADPLLGAEDYFIQPQEEERCAFEGRWYGIGSCWVAPHIYYNADIFSAEGIEPPSNDPDEAWSWDHFLETARALTIDVNGNHPGDANFDVENVDRWGVHWPTAGTQLISAILANGNDYLDPETKLIVIDQPEGLEAVQNIANLMLVDQVMPRSTVLESLGMTNTQMLDNGKLAMAIDGSWALDWMKNINATLGTGVLPKMKSQAVHMQAHLHSALAATEHPQEAWQWLRFLATPFYQLQFCRTGLWLPSQTALTTPEGLQEWITDGVHPEGYEMMVTEYLPRFGRSIYMPPGWPQANSILTPALDAVWFGDMTAEQALTTAVPEANAILQEEMSRA